MKAGRIGRTGRRRVFDPTRASRRPDAIAKDQPWPHHSYRSACTGSNRAARPAGYIPDTRLTKIANPIAPATSHQGTAQIGSGGKFCRLKYRLGPRLITRPITHPRATPRAPPITP